MTEAQTLTLADFLLARIAEDEAAARERGVHAMLGERWKHLPAADYYAIQTDWLATSRRALAECEAKRRIVEHDRSVLTYGRANGIEYQRGPGDTDAMRALAAIYSDHPDYRDEWRV